MMLNQQTATIEIPAWTEPTSLNEKIHEESSINVLDDLKNNINKLEDLHLRLSHMMSEIQMLIGRR